MATPAQPFSSLRARLSLVLILAIIPATLFLVYDAIIIRQKVQAEAESELLGTVQLIARTYEQRLDEARRLEAAIAQFPEVRAGDSNACAARLAQIVELNQPEYPTFGVANLDGDLFCTSAPVSPTVNIADRSWFVEALRTREFAVGEFTVARSGGNPILGLGYPVFAENGEVARVVSHAMQLNFLQEDIADLPLPADTVLNVADRNGTILARIPDGEIWMGLPLPAEHFQQLQQYGEGVRRAIGMDGVERFYAFTSINGPDGAQMWLSLGRTPEAIYAEANRAVTRDAIGIGIIMLAALAAVWIGSDRLLLRKIDHLVGASERLSQGDLAARVPVSARGNELDQLALTFNNMAEALQQREAQLLERERHLHLALEAARMAAWTWDPHQNHIQTTDNFADIYGLSAIEYAEQGFALLHPNDSERHQQTVRQAVTGQTPYHSEFRIIRPDDGRTVWLDERAVPVFTTDGQLQKLAGIAIDMTERKQAEERTRLLAQMGEMVRQMTVPDDFLFDVARLVGEQLQVQRSFFVEIDQANDRGLIQRDYYQGVPSVAGQYRLSDYSPEAGREMDAGHTVVNRDAQADPRTAVLYEKVYAPNDERAYVAVPLMREGQRVAVFWVSSDRPRNWSAEEVSLLEAVAERAWLAVEKMRLDQGLRRSHDTFLNLIQDAPFGVYLVDSDFCLVQISAGAQKVFSNVHPLIGRDFAEVLRVIWPEPFASEAIALFHHTLATGEPYHSPDTTEQRNDIAIVESYDWEIERIIMPDGKFGVVCYFYETTMRVQAEDDARFLADFTERIRLADTPAQIVASAVMMVGRYLRLNRCYIAEVDESQDRWWVRDDYCPDLPSIRGEYRISDYPAYIVADSRAGRMLIAEDTGTDPRSAGFYAAAYEPTGIRAHVVVPLIREGHWVANLVAATSTPRMWQPREITLLETIAERTWNAVEKLQLDARLRESEERFRSMANIIPSMVWTADREGTITYANDEWFRYVGITPEENARGWPELVLHPDDYERCLQAWTYALQTGTDYEIEVRNRRYDGEYRWFLTRARPTWDEAGRVNAWFGVTTDINERKLEERRGHFLAEATRALSASLDMNRTLQEVARLAVPEMADWCTLNLLQPNGTISLTAAAHRQPEQEARLWSWAERYPLQPEAADGTPHVIRTGKPELHHFTADGQHPPLPDWVRDTDLRSLLIVPLKSYGRTFGALSLASTESGRHFDQDDLALAEEVARRAALAMENAQLYEAEQQARELLEVRVRERTAELERSSAQLRELMVRLQTAREEEQTRLSRELHDQLGGALTVLKMNISQIQRQVTSDDLQSELDQLLTTVDETIDTTRQLARELRPAVLDYLGLAAALEWQVQEFEKRTGIRGRLLAEEMERKVEGEVATAVFRVVQEALTNVARHAQASEVNIRLQQDAEYLLLQVRDNGRGIRLEEVADAKSLGLLGMRERVRLFSGELEINGVPDEGTAVRVKIPFQDNRE